MIDSFPVLSLTCPNATFVLVFGKGCSFPRPATVQSSQEHVDPVTGLLSNAGRFCGRRNEESDQEAAKAEGRM